MSKEVYVVLTFKFHKEGKRWLGLCEELGTSTFGRSLPEAERLLDEFVLLDLNTLDDIGERERFFRENNITFHKVRPVNDVTVSVPLEEDVFIHPHIQRIPAASAS